jgi:Arc/MetJ-type ribon-helix-helix transcriptional regulator
MAKIHELRPGPGDTEKITINLGYVDLGHIDLMVRDGFYSNRTDFIRTAIRNQLDRHNDALKKSVARQQLDRTAPLQSGGPRGHPGGQGDPSYPGARAGHHRGRCLSRTGSRHDRLHSRARGLTSAAGGEGSTQRSNPLTYRLCCHGSGRLKSLAGREPLSLCLQCADWSTTMNPLKKFEMMEATRLTREGRLKEAMDLLRGSFGSSNFEATAPRSAPEYATTTVRLLPPRTESDGAWNSTAERSPDGQTDRRATQITRPFGALLD